MKPVMYLDVDGVLWVHDENGYRGAPGVAEFMDFALENYEVRWCTCWTMSGVMDEEDMARLAEWTGVPTETWRRVRPSLGFKEHKAECINWGEVDAGRPLVWVEDGLPSRTLKLFRDYGLLDSYIHTDVLEHPNALLETLAELRKRND